MPSAQKVKLAAGKVYMVDILNGEMDSIRLQIEEKNNSIISRTQSIQEINTRIRDDNDELVALNSQLILMYIQQTGKFPPS